MNCVVKLTIIRFSFSWDLSDGERYAGNQSDVETFKRMAELIQAGKPFRVEIKSNSFPNSWSPRYALVLNGSNVDWVFMMTNSAEGSFKRISFINWGNQIRYKVA